MPVGHNVQGFDPASFKDPAGHVFQDGDRIFRQLTAEGVRLWDDLKTSGVLPGLVQQCKMVETWEPSAFPPTINGRVLEHAPIPFLSYAYEWPFPLLLEAARLHLNLLEYLLPRGFILKDATPFNVQFAGTQPVLIDVLSIERHAKGDPWAAYGQFCDTLLYPLMLSAYKGIPHQALIKGLLDGIPPALMSRFFGWPDIFLKGVLFHVKIRALLHKTFEGSGHAAREEIRRAGMPTEAILKNVSNIKSVLAHLGRRKRPSSDWTAYAEKNPYEETGLAEKKAFVDRVLSDIRPHHLWDVGCNTGIFSEIALKHARYVVAMDKDESAVERLARWAKEKAPARLLPLVMDWPAPSPGLGWKTIERKSLFDRRSPEMILYLALVHHMAVGRNVPLRQQLELLAEQATWGAVFEYVDRVDPMFERLRRNNNSSFSDYTRENFLDAASRYFHIEAQKSISGTRELFVLKRRAR